MLRLALAVAMLAFVGACSTTPMAPPKNTDTKLAAAALAPTGKLRVAINFGNPVSPPKMRRQARHAVCQSISRESSDAASACRSSW